ncbi:peptidoglycan-binding protein [Kitasatospora sp. NPDC093550]|uniref:peptidoglycan-binding domain-containing protein n=1 Tax=Kitasatospora sp. NPDC093550 TaxID=3364089 RepID=UPI0038258F06
MFVSGMLSGSAQAKTGVSYIGKGYPNTRAGVWCVQHSLNYIFSTMDIHHAQIAEDSLFGPQTEEAIRYLQANDANWYTDVDGVVGPATGSTLYAWGDPKFNYSEAGTNGYCYWNLPTEGVWG